MVTSRVTSIVSSKVTSKVTSKLTSKVTSKPLRPGRLYGAARPIRSLYDLNSYYKI